MELPIVTETELFEELAQRFPDFVGEGYIVWNLRLTKRGAPITLDRIVKRMRAARYFKLVSMLNRRESGYLTNADHLATIAQTLRENRRDLNRRDCADLLREANRINPVWGRVLRLTMAGFTQTAIAEKIGIPQCTVSRILKRMR